MLLDIDIDSFELKHKFTISRGSKNSAEVITVSIKDSGFIGLGECVPYKRYGCLLYTSPSPRDRTRSRMPSSA